MIKIIIPIIGIIVILIVIFSQNKNITIENVNEIKNATIIDVRTEEEYNEGHLENSINIPLDIITTINIDKNETIYIYCRSGTRSKEAADKLKELGYINIIDLGGILNKKIELVK